VEEQARDVRKEGTLKDEERRNFECGGHRRRGNMLGASSTTASAEREQPRKSEITCEEYIMTTRVMIKEWLRKDSNMLFMLENAKDKECN
jgi:hypothetical protein